MGAGKRFSVRVPAGDDPARAALAALSAAADFAGEAGLDSRGRARLAVVVEELVSNVVRHGATGATLALDLFLTAGDGGVTIVVEDDGVAFDPTGDRGFSGPDPETGGGVGLALVRAWSSGFGYTRTDGRNRIELLLRLP